MTHLTRALPQGKVVKTRAAVSLAAALVQFVPILRDNLAGLGQPPRAGRRQLPVGNMRTHGSLRLDAEEGRWAEQLDRRQVRAQTHTVAQAVTLGLSVCGARRAAYTRLLNRMVWVAHATAEVPDGD